MSVIEMNVNFYIMAELYICTRNNEEGGGGYKKERSVSGESEAAVTSTLIADW